LQVLNGINYLHSNWIVHRDLKPSNILVMGEGKEEGTVKIADFGLARIFQAPLKPLSDNGVVVTIWYRAPELLLGAKHYTKAIDMWAVGCIFAELILLEPLFRGNEIKDKITGRPVAFQEEQLLTIFKVLGKPTQERWKDVTELPEWHRIRGWQQIPSKLRQSIQINANGTAFDLLTKMIEYDPAKRITAEEALKHPYFKEPPLPAMNSFAVPPGTKGSSIIRYTRRQVLQVDKDVDGFIPTSSSGTTTSTHSTSQQTPVSSGQSHASISVAPKSNKRVSGQKRENSDFMQYNGPPTKIQRT